MIKVNFSSDIRFNMFSFYIWLTKGQRPAFKYFLSGGNEAIAISLKFLGYPLQSLRFYHFFNEANDHRMCDTIQQSETFNVVLDREENVMHLGQETLTSSDLECTSVFLTSSSIKEWFYFHLYNCYIQDKGLHILYRGLRHISDVTINRLQLYNNGLTSQSSSMISELAVKCKVKKLILTYIGEDQQLYSVLTDPSNVLEKLHNLSCGLPVYHPVQPLLYSQR